MNRKSLFRFSAVLAIITCITLYSYFWYEAGMYSFQIAVSNGLLWVIIFFVLAIATSVASTSEYLEKKHSILFTLLYAIPILIVILFVILNGGDIREPSVGFAYTTFVLLLLTVVSYFVSIFDGNK